MNPNSARLQMLRQYVFAILSTVIATWIRHLLNPVLGDRVPFGCFFVSVLISAWIGGTGPAILSLVLGILFAAHFFIAPEGTLLVPHAADLFALAVYFLVGVVSIGLFSQLARRTREAERQSLENSRLSTELRETDRRKDEFLAVLAHELRNPLAAVRSGTMLLCRICGPDTRTIEISAMLNRQISHLSCIVDDLMDVARYIRDELTLSCETLNVQEIAREAADAVMPEMSRRKHRFHLAVGDQPLYLHGDRVRLIQILTNLMLNSAKYTPEGGRIQLFIDATDSRIRFEVRDNGVGIDRKSQRHVFELFTQVDPVPTREHGGLGLGLAIVRALTEKHGGNAVVHSKGRGHGATFIVELPRLILSDECDEKPAETAEPLAQSPPEVREAASVAASANTTGSQTQSVYIVDDNVDAANTMAMLLQIDGFRVECFEDGPAAIQALAVRPPNSVILDIGLPGMDGYEVARRIRLLRNGRAIRILACTGWGSDADIRKSIEAGIDHHLVKPVDPTRIVALLNDSLATVA